jgi:membrane-associated tyrosine/threonine-specific cdc2-inhibitory kinase
MFDVDKKIGSGYFGDVFKVRSRSDRRYYAIKISRESFKGKSDRDRKLQEVAKHEQLPKHPNLVEFFMAWEEKQRLYIQIELCDCSLADFMEKYHDVPERLIWSFLTDCLMAVQHLHSNELIHLDIKPENIFLSHGICKLGDFGLVFDLSRSDGSDASEGDPKYMAKELMQGTFTKAADIFSLGITFLEMSCDIELPSGGPGFHDLRSGNIAFLELGPHLSDDFKEVISSMMHPDPSERPTADQLLSQSVIKTVAKKRILNITFVEVAKKLRNFFLIILHFLSLILFFDYFQNAMYSSDDDDKVEVTPQHPFDYDIDHLDFDQTFSDDEDDLRPLTYTVESPFVSLNNHSTPHSPDRTFCRSQLLKQSVSNGQRDTRSPDSPTIGRSPVKRRVCFDTIQPSPSSILTASRLRSLNEFSDSDDDRDEDNTSFSEYRMGPKNLLTVSKLFVNIVLNEFTDVLLLQVFDQLTDEEGATDS